ncbi:MAG: AAA family ATPase [Candidatus Limnocylindrales bacterium]|jgi:cell division protease FtsH
MTYATTSNLAAPKAPTLESQVADPLGPALPDRSPATPTPEFAPTASWLANHRVQIGGLSLDQIVGLDAAKEQIRSLVACLRNPDALEAMGAATPKGVLFYGPPGCGKTTCARVFSSLLAEPRGPDERPVPVTFYEANAAELRPEVIGGLHAYLLARFDANADSEPPEGPGGPISAAPASMVVLYLDELDLIARDRGDYRKSDEANAALYALLSLLDGLREHRRLLVVASSSASPSEFDAALLRPGRLGFQVPIPYPSLAERVTFFEHFLRSRRCAEPLDLQRAAELVGPGTSPAEIRQMLDDAAALSLADGFTALTAAALDRAIERRGVIVKRRSQPSPEQDQIVSVHEAGHALIGALLDRAPTAISIVGHPLLEAGHTIFEGDEDDEYSVAGLPRTDGQLLDQICVALAGLEAENLVLGGRARGVGAASDLRAATSLARTRIDHGLDAGYRVISRSLIARNTNAGYLYEHEAYLAASATLMECRGRVSSLLAAHEPALLTLAARLVRDRQLQGPVLRDLLTELTADGRTGPGVTGPKHCRCRGGSNGLPPAAEEGVLGRE